MRLLFLFLSIALVAGCVGSAPSQNFPKGKENITAIEETHRINLVAPEALDAALQREIKAKVWDSLLPYQGIGYNDVNVTVVEKSPGYELDVIATTKSSPYTDAYRFFYDPGEDSMLLKGYLLEALPEEVRSKTVATALGDEEIQRSFYTGSFTLGEPTVRRVLPSTAERFYTPKTLFSVTWADFEKKVAVSALVDVDEGRVVERWQGE